MKNSTLKVTVYSFTTVHLSKYWFTKITPCYVVWHCKYIYSILGIQRFLLEKMPILNAYKIIWPVAHMILCYFWTLIQFWKTLIPSPKLWFKIYQLYRQCFWQTWIWPKNAKNVILVGIDLATTKLPFLMRIMGDYSKNLEHL